MIQVLFEDRLLRVEHNPSMNVVRVARTSAKGEPDYGAIEKLLPPGQKLLLDVREGSVDAGAERLFARFTRVAVLGKRTAAAASFDSEDAAFDHLLA